MRAVFLSVSLLFIFVLTSGFCATNSKYTRALTVLAESKRILTEHSWNRNDDRLCCDDVENATYSLYCALRISQCKLYGKYKHRGLVMRTVRKVVRQHAEHSYKHPIRDHNNLESTTLEEVISILDEAMELLSKHT